MPKGPTKEIGALINSGQFSVAAWNLFSVDDLELVPELQFPQSARTYHSMLNDSQVEGLFAGATWPIRRYKWMIDPNGCDDSKVAALSKDLNLPIKGKDPEPLGRTKKRFSFSKHMEDALRACVYGFYDFEQVGEVGDDGLWHLRKLAPRPPTTIEDIRLNSTGGLLSIIQNVVQTQQGFIGGPPPEIPIDRIVHYSWDQQGANHFGRSMCRAIYRNWLIKDRLLRIDAIKHERNGVGVPIGIGAQGYTKGDLAKLASLAQSFRAGESAGGAIPFGTDLKLLGVEGTIPDTVASINLHNEEMAKRFLLMFMQLGSSSHGSKGMAGDFIEYLQLAQEMIANWFVEIFTSHVIEDWWDWNYGDNEELTPRLYYQRNDDPRFAAADLALMIQNNVIQVDDQVETSVRDAMDLPDKDPSTTRPNLNAASGGLNDTGLDGEKPVAEGQPSNVPEVAPPKATGKATMNRRAGGQATSPAFDPARPSQLELEIA